MDYSIVMPVFNREDLTHACLATLRPTLEGAGAGELIVVDNGSRPETAAVLAQFPWVRVIRNEANLGFAAACNQGARAANGRVICHLNNDIIAQPRWLERMLTRLKPGVGIVGARLLFPNDTLQHAGVVTYPVRFGPEGVGPFHLYWGWAKDTAAANEPADFDIVTGACLVTPRDLFLELGGFDEGFWNGYEDVDYCLKVRAHGLRVVYEPSATLYHYESQSGVQRKRRLSHNLRLLGQRWGDRIEPDHNRFWLRSGWIRREIITPQGRAMTGHTVPPTTIVVHGPAPSDPDGLMAPLTESRLPRESIVWLAAGSSPSGSVGHALTEQPVAALRQLLAGRRDAYIALVDTRTELEPGWLDELVSTIEFGSEVFAATVVPRDEMPATVEPCATDARCALINLRNLPAHIRFGDVETLDAALVDLSWQGVCCGLGVRAVRSDIARLAPAVSDAVFDERYGLGHDELRRSDDRRLEEACQTAAPRSTLASIVMLSWNAPEYTKIAVDSIRAHTKAAYEIIIVDNGSRPETLAALGQLTDVRIIYNASNTGFAYGCNQGIAAATGTHIVLLNNDVVVTEGWLEALLDAHARDPLVGVSAPRSNRVAGHQQLPCGYDSLEEMHAFANTRRREMSGNSYRTNRAIGFCLCISRTVIEEVGGIDTRYDVGNFEDDDFSIRVRAAGYQIVICEDVFIHHFGSVSFRANNIDYQSQMQKNWRIFAARWGLSLDTPLDQGYDSRAAIARGFERERDYVELPSAKPVIAQSAKSIRTNREYATAFVAVIDSDAAWSRIGPVVTNYIKALSADDSALFSIGVVGDSDAHTIGRRITRSIAKLNLDENRVADIDVADIEAVDEWLASIPAAAQLRVGNDDRLAALTLVADRSPSGIARTVRRTLP